MKTSTSYLAGLILEDQEGLTLDDLCRACAAQSDLIMNLVQEGLLSPLGAAPDLWRFNGVHLHRATVAVRLQRDLGVNPAGAALALDLMEELNDLRAQLGRLQD